MVLRRFNTIEQDRTKLLFPRPQILMTDFNFNDNDAEAIYILVTYLLPPQQLAKVSVLTSIYDMMQYKLHNVFLYMPFCC